MCIPQIFFVLGLYRKAQGVSAVPGALADYTAGQYPSHVVVGQDAPGLRLEHRNKLQGLHVGFILGTLVG